MAEETLLTIRSEEDAWKLLNEALEGTLKTDGRVHFDFEEWPNVQVHLTKTPDATITPSMMKAFIELQDTIYRAHTFLASDTGNLRTLTNVEREQFEFRVKVSPGSSDYKIDLTEIAKSLGTDVINKMDGNHLTITILGIAIILGSVVAFKAWLAHKASTRKNDSEDTERKLMMETLQANFAQETKRAELLVRAIERQPVLGEIEASADVARAQIVRAVAEEKGGEVMGVSLAPEIAGEVTTQKRQQSTVEKISGIYRVAKVDTTASDGFRVTLEDVKLGTEITASLIDALVSWKHKVAIQNAEWAKTNIFVEMSARRLRQRVVDAVVVDVKSLEEHDAETLS